MIQSTLARFGRKPGQAKRERNCFEISFGQATQVTVGHSNNLILSNRQCPLLDQNYSNHQN